MAPPSNSYIRLIRCLPAPAAKCKPGSYALVINEDMPEALQVGARTAGVLPRWLASYAVLLADALHCAALPAELGSLA
jgi:hypothetical protein